MICGKRFKWSHDDSENKAFLSYRGGVLIHCSVFVIPLFWCIKWEPGEKETTDWLELKILLLYGYQQTKIEEILVPENKFCITCSRTSGPHESRRDRSLKALVYSLLEIICSKYQRSNTWQEIRVLPSKKSRQTCLLSSYCVLNIIECERTWLPCF